MYAYFVLFFAILTLSVYSYAGGCFSSCCESEKALFTRKVDELTDRCRYGTSAHKSKEAGKLRAEIRFSTLEAEQKEVLINRLKPCIQEDETERLFKELVTCVGVH